MAITYNIYVNFVNDKIKDYFVNRKNYIETLSGHTSLEWTLAECEPVTVSTLNRLHRIWMDVQLGRCYEAALARGNMDKLINVLKT